MIYGCRNVILQIKADVINLGVCETQFLEYVVTQFYHYLNMQDIRLVVALYDVIFKYINTIHKGREIIKYIDNDCKEKGIEIF